MNDGRIHDESFDHRRNGLFVVQTGRQDRNIEADLFVGDSQGKTTTKEPQ
jgi:hypothetical protein